MANVVTENILLLIPSMIILIVFPVIATQVTNNYYREQSLILVEATGNELGSALQQLTMLMSLKETQFCTVSLANPIGPTIQDQQYQITATQEGDTLVMHINLPGIPVYYDHRVTLSDGVTWDGGTLNSNYPTAGIEASKDESGIRLRFR